MEKFVKIAAKEGEAVADLLLDDDNSLSISTLHKYFPNAEGLKYYSDSDAVYHVICDEEKFYAPHRGWSDTIYYCTYGNVKEETVSIEDIPIQGEEEEEEEEEEEKEVKIVYISTNDRTKNVKKKKIKPKGKNKKRKPYKCDVCEKNFRNKDYMEKHKLVHTGEKPFSCSICEERFHRPDMVRLHVHKVHNIRREPKLKLPPRSPTAKREKRRNDTTYEWGVVKKRKYTRKKTELNQMNLEEVYLENSSDNPHNKYECGSCEMLFSDEVLFQEHSCSPQTQFTCEECSETFPKLNKLRLHFYKHHGPEQKKIVSRKFSKIRPQKYLNISKQKTKSKYATNELEYVESDNDTSGDECSYWDCLNENEIRKSYVSKCDCVPNFSMLKYIENKIPSEVLAKFRRCKQNHIAWTGFLGYSALYKFWVRIVTDNPPEMNEINVNDEEKDDCLKDADYFVVEEEEPSEATTENTNFLKSLDDLIKFN